MKKLQIGMVMLLGSRCRCGHEWLPRGEEKPRVCPKCKSANWDRPKRIERKK
jgi:predicted Zn-ribbon and HTH transcriptional regulator